MMIETPRPHALAVTALLLGSALSFAPCRAGAQDEAQAAPAPSHYTRFRLVLNGAAVLGKVSYGETLRFTEFSEEGSLDADFEAKAAPAIDGGLQFNITRRFGVAAGLTVARRDDAASYSTSLPHPLYLNQPRSKAGGLDGLALKETAFHLDVVFNAESGSLAVHAFGGASFFNVKTDLLDRVQYSHVYPYDSDQVTVTSVPTSSLTDKPVGFNAGAGLDYRIGRTLGVGLQARFSRARVSLTPAGGTAVEFDAGGFQAGGGLRLYF